MQRKALVKELSNLRGVSSTFRDASWEFMMTGVNEVVSEGELAVIKKRVGGLDLSSLYPAFIKEVRAKWGSDPDADADDYYDVDHIFEGFGGTETKFAELVGHEYKQMMVVKAVETIAIRKGDAPAVWTEKRQVNNVIDLFWHAHMLAPCKYQADCNIVLEETIDHDAGYVSNNDYQGSDYTTKRDLLFKFELEHFPTKWSFFGTSATLFGNSNFDHVSWHNQIVEEMHGENDCG